MAYIRIIHVPPPPPKKSKGPAVLAFILFLFICYCIDESNKKAPQTGPVQNHLVQPDADDPPPATDLGARPIRHAARPRRDERVTPADR